MNVTIPLNHRTLAAVLALIGGVLLLSGRGCTLPDVPWPPVTPAPITESGLRVLIVEETEARFNLSSSQRDILTAAAPGSVRDFCKQHCVRVNDNPEFRVFDKDAPLDHESKLWQEAWSKIPKDAPLPYLLISNGRTGYMGPITPEMTRDQVLALLNKYKL